MAAITTGGLSDMNVAGGAINFTISEFLRPIQQTANYCSLDYKPPFVVHGFLPSELRIPGAITDEQLHQEAQRYKQLLLQQIAS